MPSKTIGKKRREEYLQLLNSAGEERLFKGAIGIGMKQAASNHSPEIEILDESEALLKLFRQTGKEEYLILSKILRKAAHVVYRQLINQNPDKQINTKRFLTVVA